MREAGRRKPLLQTTAKNPRKKKLGERQKKFLSPIDNGNGKCYNHSVFEKARPAAYAVSKSSFPARERKRAAKTPYGAAKAPGSGSQTIPDGGAILPKTTAVRRNQKDSGSGQPEAGRFFLADLQSPKKKRPFFFFWSKNRRKNAGNFPFTLQKTPPFC